MFMLFSMSVITAMTVLIHTQWLEVQSSRVEFYREKRGEVLKRM